MRKQEAERLERIRANEEKMDRCLAALSLIQTALEQWRAVQEDLRDLEVYYTGADWKRDYEADEKGLLPQDLKRGVLSQDGIGEMLDDAAELGKDLREILEEETQGNVVE